MSPKLPHITAAELLRALYRDGWQVKRQTGSHLQLKHPDKPGRITVAFHPGIAIKPKTLANILETAGLTIDELRRLL